MSSDQQQQQYYNNTNNNSNSMLNWQFVPNNSRSQVNYVNNMGQSNMPGFMNESNMISLESSSSQPPQQMQQPMQQQQNPQQAQTNGNIIDPLQSSFNMMYSWNPNVPVPPVMKDEWSMNANNNPPAISNQQPPQILSYSPQQQQLQQQQQQQQQQLFSLSPIPPVSSSSTYPTNNINNIINNSMNMNMPRSSFNEMPRSRPVSYNDMRSSTQMPFNNLSMYQAPPPPPQQQPQQQMQTYSPEITASSSSTGSNSPISTPPPLNYFLPKQQPTYMMQPTLPPPPPPVAPKRNNRRKSAGGPTRTYRRRASSHPSVASVVSLSAHEPVARVIDGIEHITFLYSHDRLVKEYTVRTDVGTVNLDDIPLDFRVQNAIYPRANVSREEYDGNRWEYETSCNRLGWELCWLNQEELCGRRGLIQRAVDSYRNRHAEMRSRRVTRQEKVANGTLRKRRAKKTISAIL